MALKKVIFLEKFLVCLLLFLLTITNPALARHKDSSDEDSKESGGHHHRIPQEEGHRKVDRDTTSPTSQRYTSARAYVDDRKRGEGYRYYGTGSKCKLIKIYLHTAQVCKCFDYFFIFGFNFSWEFLFADKHP